MQVDPLRLEPVLQMLVELDWVGQLSEEGVHDVQARYVLLVDLDTTVLEPLMRAALLKPDAVTENLWKIGRWPATTLREALQK